MMESRGPARRQPTSRRWRSTPTRTPITACWPRCWPRPRTRRCRRSASSRTSIVTTEARPRSRRSAPAGKTLTCHSAPPIGRRFFCALAVGPGAGVASMRGSGSAGQHRRRRVMAFSARAPHPRRMAEINITPLVGRDAGAAGDLHGRRAGAVAADRRRPCRSRPSESSASRRRSRSDLRIDAAGEVYWNDPPHADVGAAGDDGGRKSQRDRRNQPRLEIDASGDADYQAVAKVHGGWRRTPR